MQVSLVSTQSMGTMDLTSETRYVKKPADCLFNLTIGRKGYKRMDDHDNCIILLRTTNPMGNV